MRLAKKVEYLSESLILQKLNRSRTNTNNGILLRMDQYFKAKANLVPVNKLQEILRFQIFRFEIAATTSILLLLDSVDTIFKLQSIEDKKSFEYKFLHVHLLGNINKMFESLIIDEVQKEETKVTTY